MNEESKKPWQSRTLWMSLITCLLGFFPPAQVLIAANPEVASVAIGGIFGLLRGVTKGKVNIK